MPYLSINSSVQNNKCSCNQETLVKATKSSDFKVVKVCLQRGEEVNRIKNNFILSRFAAIGDLKAVKYLLDRGARTEAQNILGQTALFVAVKNGHLEIVKYLLNQGCRTDAQDMFGQTRLLAWVRGVRIIV